MSSSNLSIFPAAIICPSLFIFAGVKSSFFKTTDYAKIAIAIGQMKSNGVQVFLPHINLSRFNFSPNIEKNRIVEIL